MYRQTLYSYRYINSDNLKYTPISLKDIKRIDYFDITDLDLDGKFEFFNPIHEAYIRALTKGEDYRDDICHRYYFNKFVVRETTNEGDTRFYLFELSDWDKDDKERELDSRDLRCTIYTLVNRTKSFEFDMSFVIKAGHKDKLFHNLAEMDKCIKTERDWHNTNFYVIPLYLNIDEGTKYTRISDFKYYIGMTRGMHYIHIITQAIARFNAFNFWMISTIETNSDIDIKTNKGIKTFNTLQEYVKTKVTDDKKITIILDKDTGAKLNIYKSNRNILDHYNHRCLSVMDYKFQVCAHYQGYWYGSRKNNTLHKKYKWKESYWKNINKDYNVIKERKLLNY